MSDQVLLTGVSGFLGGHVALELLRAGYHVRGSLRNPARESTVRRALEAQGADLSRLSFVTLDLERDAGWAEAADGVRYLIHAASPFVTSMPSDRAALIRPAVAGTERAIGAALSHGIERVVLTSSSVAIVAGRGRGGRASLSADDWADPDSGRLNAYAESKVRAERRAWKLMEAAGRGHDLCVINPGFILGPLLDDDSGTSVAIIQRLLGGAMPAAPQLHLHVVDVRDVARIHVAALTSDRAGGRRHPTAFSTASLIEMCRVLRDVRPDRAGKLPRHTLPNWVARLYASVNSDLRANVRELGYRPEIDASPALALLGRPPVALDATLGATADSLIARRLV